MYFFGKREKGLLVPAIILISLAFIFWSGSIFLFIFKLWPLILIAFGGYLVYRGYMKQKRQAHE
jgi:lipopolysaccharide export LptBFGC system permease protein LptF